MKCTNCDNINPSGSNFCQKCGAKLAKKDDPKASHAAQSSSNNKNSLWDKFVEVYDSKDKERQKYLDLMTNEAWELIERVGLNTFEKFIDDYKDQLNKQPYRLIEQIKNIFSWSVSGGYWMWYAESEYNKRQIKPIETVDFELLKKEWNKISVEEFSKTFEGLSEQLKDLINIYLKIRVNTLLENDSIKDVTNETIEKLKEALSLNILWGYTIGLAEDKFRNKS